MSESNLDAVLEAMINEVNAMHQARRPAHDHQLNAVETCRQWLKQEGEQNAE